MEAALDSWCDCPKGSNWSELGPAPEIGAAVRPSQTFVDVSPMFRNRERDRVVVIQGDARWPGRHCEQVHLNTTNRVQHDGPVTRCDDERVGIRPFGGPPPATVNPTAVVSPRCPPKGQAKWTSAVPVPRREFL